MIMRKHLKNAFDRLLKARRVGEATEAILEDVSAVIAPVMQLIEHNRIFLEGPDAVELELEFAILTAVCECSKKALARAEKSACDSAEMYVQIEALMALSVDTEEGEEKFAEEIDNCNMRTEEVLMLSYQAEDGRRKVLALIPSL